MRIEISLNIPLYRRQRQVSVGDAQLGFANDMGMDAPFDDVAGHVAEGEAVLQTPLPKSPTNDARKRVSTGHFLIKRKSH